MVDNLNIDPYMCYPQQLRVPLTFVLHKYTKEEKESKGIDADFITYHLRGDYNEPYYYVLPYENCRIVSRKNNGCGEGEGEQVRLQRANRGPRQKFRKTHCILSACMGYLEPDETVEHLDQVYNAEDSNRLENLVWMSNIQNAYRNGKLMRKDTKRKIGLSMEKPVLRISVATGERTSFSSAIQAMRMMCGEKIRSEQIARCCKGKIRTHPRGKYRWEYLQQQQLLREPPLGSGIVRREIYLKNLSREQQDFAHAVVPKNALPPHAVSNLGEVLTSRGKWTIGNLRPRRKSKRARFYNNVNVSKWVQIYFNGIYDRDSQQINHCDGDDNDPKRYNRFTYLSDGSYSNYLGTFYLGTQQENMEDLGHARKRKRHGPATMHACDDVAQP